jgi:hypothetical protein
MLVDVKDRVKLPPACRGCVDVPVNGHRETAFAVDEPNDPERIELEYRRSSGFLLIVRTGRIFTTHGAHPKNRVRHPWMSTAGYSDVPAYSQVL